MKKFSILIICILILPIVTALSAEFTIKNLRGSYTYAGITVPNNLYMVGDKIKFNASKNLFAYSWYIDFNQNNKYDEDELVSVEDEFNYIFDSALTEESKNYTIALYVMNSSYNIETTSQTIKIEGNYDGDKLPDSLDSDDDNDGFSDVDEKKCGYDTKNAGSKPPDCNKNKIGDCQELDTDKDGVIDDCDDDDDNDGWEDVVENSCYTKSNVISNSLIDSIVPYDEDRDHWPDNCEDSKYADIDDNNDGCEDGKNRRDDTTTGNGKTKKMTDVCYDCSDGNKVAISYRDDTSDVSSGCVAKKVCLNGGCVDDTDDDNVPDIEDLDDNNDGCEDGKNKEEDTTTGPGKTEKMTDVCYDCENGLKKPVTEDNDSSCQTKCVCVNGVEKDDFDNNGNPDETDTDDDNDGIPDTKEAACKHDVDCDDDGICDGPKTMPQYYDSGNTAETGAPEGGCKAGPDEFPTNSNEWADSDKDSIGDNEDKDDDNDGHLDKGDDNCYGRCPASKPNLPSGYETEEKFNNDMKDKGYTSSTEISLTEVQEPFGILGAGWCGSDDDIFPLDPTAWSDKDCDGVADNYDDFDDSCYYSKDTDKDGKPDDSFNCPFYLIDEISKTYLVDSDDDNDSKLDTEEPDRTSYYFYPKPASIDWKLSYWNIRLPKHPASHEEMLKYIYFVENRKPTAVYYLEENKYLSVSPPFSSDTDDPAKDFKEKNNYIAKLETWYNAAAGETFDLKWGSDDAGEIYLNGELVDSWYDEHGWSSGQKTTTLNFKPGWNHIEIWYEEIAGGDGFYHANLFNKANIRPAENCKKEDCLEEYWTGKLSKGIKFKEDPTEWNDTDGDGIGNNEDPDDDNDGHPDLGPDGIPNTEDDDKCPYDVLEFEDSDNDGICNGNDNDNDNDGVNNTYDDCPLDATGFIDLEKYVGKTPDGKCMKLWYDNGWKYSTNDTDSDGDGVNDDAEPDVFSREKKYPHDIKNINLNINGTVSYVPLKFAFDPAESSDNDGDGIGDNLDDDDDNDATIPLTWYYDVVFTYWNSLHTSSPNNKQEFNELKNKVLDNYKKDSWKKPTTKYYTTYLTPTSRNRYFSESPPYQSKNLEDFNKKDHYIARLSFWRDGYIKFTWGSSGAVALYIDNKYEDFIKGTTKETEYSVSGIHRYDIWYEATTGRNYVYFDHGIYFINYLWNLKSYHENMFGQIQAEIYGKPDTEEPNKDSYKQDPDDCTKQGETKGIKFKDDPEEWNDMDGDGIGDNEDNDIDGDKVCNWEDNCPEVSNPCEPTEDTDKDGIADAIDNCPKIKNVNQKDTDRDGEGDACDDDIDGDGLTNDEEKKEGTNEREKDTDGDGYLDGEDCAPKNGNPGYQKDTDGNGACDGADDDDDGDGIPDVYDACPLNKAEFLDTDGDGICNGLDPDDDGDGVCDYGVNAANYKCEGNEPSGFSCNSNKEIKLSTETYSQSILDNLVKYSYGAYSYAYTDKKLQLYFSLDSSESSDIDEDCIGDDIDQDIDGDGINNTDEPDYGKRQSFNADGTPKGITFKYDPTEWSDMDNDSIGDNEDPTTDTDEIPDSEEPQGCSCYANGNKKINPLKAKYPDKFPSEEDRCLLFKEDSSAWLDADNDCIDNSIDKDIDGDSKGNIMDDDKDGDGYLNTQDNYPTDHTRH